ncbi:MAG: ABC transporter permease [Burkholderiaceae bacterium]
MTRLALPWGLSSPAALFMLCLLGVPVVMLLGLSLNPFVPGLGVGEGYTLAHYADLASDDYFHAIFLRTLSLSCWVTLGCLLIGVPEAWILARLSPRWRAVSMVIVLGPLLISVIVRTLGWAVLLGSEGLLNRGLLAVGLIESPVRMMYTFTAMTVALIHVLVPFMVLSVWASLQRIDPATLQAAASLGASSLTVFRRIVLPQIVPGMLSGVLIVFAMAASAFATPAIIGGRRLKVVPTTIYDEFLGNLNWPLGAALAAVLLVIVLAVTLGTNRFVEWRWRRVFQ